MGSNEGDVRIGEGRFLRLVSRDGWELVQRTNASGVVIIVGVTDSQELILVEQYRPPLQSRVIELPAGLAGDIPGQESEALALAAARELEEETGFQASAIRPVASGPVSAGITDEQVTIFLATGLSRVGPGGGDDSEDITVHLVPLASAGDWLSSPRDGVMVDPKVYAALYFARGA